MSDNNPLTIHKLKDETKTVIDEIQPDAFMAGHGILLRPHHAKKEEKGTHAGCYFEFLIRVVIENRKLRNFF